MEPLFNIFLIAAMLLIGFALWRTWVIFQKGKREGQLSQKDAAKIDRWFIVVKICVYAIVVVFVIRFYLSTMAG